MAKHFFLNNFPANNRGTLPDLVARLLANGWVLKSSGDGNTNFDGTGVTNYFTQAAIAASSAAQFPWCRIKFPGSARELCISKRNDGTGQPGRAFRIKYSFAAGFTQGPAVNGVPSGSPGANSVPSASDETVILGNPAINDDTNSGSGQAPFTGDGTYVYHIMVDDASPAFWLVAYFNGPNSGTGLPRSTACLMVDPVVNNDPRDLDPFVFYITNMGANVTPFVFRADSSLNSDAGNGQGPQALFRAKLSNMVWDFVAAPGLWAYNRNASAWQLVLPRAIGTNPLTGKEDLWPLRYFGQAYLQSGGGGTSPFGGHWKGISTLMAWASNSRNTATLNAAKTKILIDDVWLDWDGATTPIV